MMQNQQFGLILAASTLCGCAMGSSLSAVEEETLSAALDRPGSGPAGDSLRKEKRRAIRRGAWVPSFGAGLSIGHTDNIYAAPSQLPGSSAGPRSSSFAAMNARLRMEKSFFDIDRFDSSLEIFMVEYDRGGNSAIRDVDLNLEYDIELGEQLDWRNDFKLARDNDHAANIAGQPYQRDFASWRYSLSTGLNRKFGKRSQLFVGYDIAFKDYDETSGLSSIDWWNHTLILRYRYRFNSEWSGRIWARFGYQRYREELANSGDDGSEVPGNPDEEHLSSQFTTWFTWKPNRHLKWDVQYRWSAKNDLFEDYESYQNHRFKLSAEYMMDKRWQLNGEVKWDIRHFDRRPAEQDNGKLNYQRLQMRLDLWRVLSEHAAAYVSYSYQMRDSNRTFGDVYRDYDINLIMLGVAASF